MNKRKSLLIRIASGFVVLIVIICLFLMTQTDVLKDPTQVAKDFDSQIIHAQNDESEKNGEQLSAKMGDATQDRQSVLIHGFVTIAGSGEQVTGAQVYFVGDHQELEEREYFATTDDDGRFEFSCDFRGKGHLFARKDHLITYKKRKDIKSLQIGEEDTSIGPIHLELKPAGVLKIKVVAEEDERVLPGAFAQTEKAPRQRFEDNQDGLLTLPLSQEVWHLKISAPGFEEKLLDVDLSMGVEEVLLVKLSQAGRIYGYVCDEQGNPLPDVSVQVTRERRELAALSDENGIYEIKYLPLLKPLGLKAIRESYRSFFGEVMIESKGQLEVNLVLSKLPKLPNAEDYGVEGRVVDSQDRPLEKALITLHPMRTIELQRRVYSDDQGHFRLPIIPQEEDVFQLKITKPGFAFEFLTLKKKLSKKVQLKIILEQGNFISGNIINSSGEPLPHAEVMILPQVSIQFFNIKSHADSEGYFEFDQLPEKVELLISAEGYSTKQMVQPELNREYPDLVLKGMGSLTGTVVYAETGEPVTSYRVFLSKKRPRSNPSVYLGDLSLFSNGILVNNKNGAFQIDDLEIEKPMKLMVRAENHALENPIKVTVRSPEKAAPLLVELKPSKDRYRGIVIDTHGRALPDAEVTLFCDPQMNFGTNPRRVINNSGNLSFRQTLRTNGQGQFAFEKIPQGSGVFIRAWKQGYSEDISQNLASLSDDDKKNLVLELPRSGTIKVIIKNKTIPDMTSVTLFQNSGFVDKKHTSGEQREMEFTSLGPGRYRMYLAGYMSSGSRSANLQYNRFVDLSEGETRVVELGEDEDRKLSGQALVGNRPLAKRTLLLKHMDGYYADRSMSIWGKSVETDHAGRFSFNELESGSYKLMLMPRQSRWNNPYVSMGEFDSKNFVTVTIAAEDVEDVFFFAESSSIRGGLTKAKGITSVLLSKQSFPTAESYQSPLDAHNRFHFLDIDPGVYILHTLSGKPVRALTVRSGIVVPAFGSDLDLGLLDEAPLKHKQGNLKKTQASKE